MKRKFPELKLVVWINSYNPQEQLITNATLLDIVERGQAFVFSQHYKIFFIIISLHEYCWKIAVFCPFYLETEFLI